MAALREVIPTPSTRYTVLPLKRLLAYKSEHADFVTLCTIAWGLQSNSALCEIPRKICLTVTFAFSDGINLPIKACNATSRLLGGLGGISFV